MEAWYRHRWPWILMAGPALVIVAGTYTSWLAYSHPDALVAGDYYKQGKAINQDLRRQKAAQSEGMAVTLGFNNASDRLEGAITREGKPYTQAVWVHLRHATQPEKDLNLLLVPDAQGRVSQPLPALQRSRWQVSVEDHARSWLLETTWQFPDQAAISL